MKCKANTAANPWISGVAVMDLAQLSPVTSVHSQRSFCLWLKYVESICPSLAQTSIILWLYLCRAELTRALVTTHLFKICSEGKHMPEPCLPYFFFLHSCTKEFPHFSRSLKCQACQYNPETIVALPHRQRQSVAILIDPIMRLSFPLGQVQWTKYT